MCNPSIGYEIFCALFLLGLAAVLIYFVYKENKRAKERHKKYIEALDVVCNTLPLLYSINGCLNNFVGKYMKDNEYN